MIIVVLVLFLLMLTFDAVIMSFALWRSWSMPAVVIVFVVSLISLVWFSGKINGLSLRRKQQAKEGATHV